ncbi:FAD-dependent oxidoreductase [Microbacterium jiangjiandongii]|uniref:FAD-dependent oxidoreductase n=1 Tax=Microbacterium jiangjiandongii TaxID=3049071 RepID=UPI00214BAEFB|nr:FAD-dependent oxidoreductase [Microbacterium sp. zg.Y843]MCR2816699.1 FAD-dependent oxidoreductase [Microbacterium sp. zg.Y843]
MTAPTDRTPHAPTTGPRIVIVGGVAAGMSAATRLRRLDETAQIVVFERGRHVSFANCGLPYYVGGVITERDALLLQTPASLRARFALDVRVEHEVLGIDRAARTVTARDAVTGATVVEPYDHLILATGAAPRERATASAGAPVVATLRTVDDVDRITAVLAETGDRCGRAVVMGAGFIGLEATENLVRRGLDVTLVQHGARPFMPLDPEMAAAVIEALASHGVDVRTATTVDTLDAAGAHLSDGTVIAADLVVDARGVAPAADLARTAGLAIGTAGGVVVDGHQRTEDPRIFAVGDTAEKTDAVSGAATLVTMAGLANRHGRAAADVIAWENGRLDTAPRPAAPALGTAIIGLFDVTVAMVGWSEQRLVAAGRAHRVIHTHPTDHAGYYPGAERMAMKVMVDPLSGLILGAQIVGGKGVDKRIDVIATAMHAGLPAAELAHLELAYAPQYASAKDPVNMVGYIAENLAAGVSDTVQWHELAAAVAGGATLVDVRSPQEFAAGAIPGSINIPVDALREGASTLPEGELIVHCQVGQRGHTAARILAQLGRRARNLDGGYLTWKAGAAVTALQPA